ncbi:MAG: glycosyl transferase group 1 [Solirubrobacterales bacterium]|nr:glycosyl transferase group 1 [Solirubrobacterales bacterium]
MSPETSAALLVAMRRPPWPLDNGARIRGHELVRGLSEAFAVTLVTYQHQAGSADGPTDLGALGESLPGVEIVPVPGLGSHKRAAQGVGLVRRRSFNWGRYRSAGFAEALARTAAERGARIVHYDDLGSALNGPLPGLFNVYSSHNVEHVLIGSQAHSGSAVRRAFNSLEAARIQREEARVWRAMDLVLAVSEDDAALVRAGGAEQVALCPNGTAPVPLLPRAPRATGAPVRVVFVGSGGYMPYERGLAWFVSEVLPRVREQLPVVFDVVGQPPHRPVAADGVTYVGRVPSVTPYYEQAHVVVVPVFEGSGTRLKLIEAAAHGRPVVSTALGAQGLGMTPGEHYLEADDPSAFAAAIVRLAHAWEQPAGGELAALVQAARTASERFFWPAITDALIERYRAAAGLS